MQIRILLNTLKCIVLSFRKGKSKIETLYSKPGRTSKQNIFYISSIQLFDLNLPRNKEVNRVRIFANGL